jgi:hypothetical protein
MNISDFLRFNRRCPICDEPLGLYMQWIDSVCFRAKVVGDDTYQFDSYIGTNKGIKTDDLWESTITMFDRGDEVGVKFSTSALRIEGEKHQAYLFYLCNPAGFKKQSWGEFEISTYKGCYYRASPMIQMRDFKYEVINPDHKDIVNGKEAFCLKVKTKELEKVYTIEVNDEEKKTNFWYYSVSESEKAKTYFKPNLFSKEMPLLPTRFKLDLRDRSNLIDRLDAWLIMS